MTGFRDGPRFDFLASAVNGLSAGRPAGCIRPLFSLAQVRKPGAAVVVAAQALTELKPGVAQLGGAGDVGGVRRCRV